MRYQPTTGLDQDQIRELTRRVDQVLPSPDRPFGRPAARFQPTVSRVFHRYSSGVRDTDGAGTGKDARAAGLSLGPGWGNGGEAGRSSGMPASSAVAGAVFRVSAPPGPVGLVLRGPAADAVPDAYTGPTPSGYGPTTPARGVVGPSCGVCGFGCGFQTRRLCQTRTQSRNPSAQVRAHLIHLLRVCGFVF